MRTNSQKKSPLFIVIDGGDGSGKDTQVKFISKYYLNKGFRNIRIRSHPATDNTFGRHAKKALEEGGKKGYLKAAVFYAIDVIRSLLKYYKHNEDEIVIFSRYLLGVCYLPTSLVLFAYNFFAAILPTSQYFFFLDVSPEVAKKRIAIRGEKEEMFEKISRLKKMRRKMRLITQKKGWYLINGNYSPLDVWIQIKKILESLDKKE